ncbi:hypothetical protein FSP39_010623 [Pinctada imbricata]|uniref:Protein kinase domain-containing protein n=1 Tax=Pinctada imbricata TaxID=66713 RepID=A0AA89BNC4_PINIB|nr:hypothetical protein FSP39_010623 [Pinctada imbricata]
MQILKTIRHPSIVRFIGSCNVGSQSNLVVERCIPLTSVVDELEPLEISSGLHGLVEGLSFLHEKMAIAHNNVCPDAVFVAHNGSWKLGELEHACKFLEVTPDYLQKSRKYRNEHSLSPEEKANTLMITAELGHTRDVYSFGIMVECLLERLQELGDLIKTFELRIQDECLNPDPRQRPKLTSLMDDQLFRNDLLSVRRFLQDITLKSLKERETFFRGLTRKLLGLPEEVVGKHLSQLLLCRFVLLDQHASLFIPNLLTPCTDVRPSTENQGGISPILTEVTFKQYLIPEILKAFHCHDYHIRMILLTHFPYFIHLFDKDVLETSILPQVLLGIRDINNDLAALSLHCLGDLVTVLGRDAVIGGRSKTYFTKGTPNFKHGSNFYTENQDVSNGMPPKTLLKELANSSLKDANKEKEVQKRKDEMERRRKERQERQKALKLKREQADIERNKQEEPRTQQDIPRGEHSLIENLKSSMTEIRPTEASIDDGSYLITKQSPAKNKKSDDIPIESDIYFTKEDGQSSENDWSDWENDILEEEENLSKSPKRFEETYIDKLDRNTSPKVIQQKLSDIDSELRLKKDDDLISQIPGDFMKSKIGEKSQIVETINVEDTSISRSVKKPVLKNALKLQSKKEIQP